jgi:hypothetical protein
MPKRTYKITSKVWLYPGMTGWHFATVPKEESVKIKKDFAKYVRGWGSFPVNVVIGKSKWKTSIFPDSMSGRYLLPLKKKIRKEEGIMAGDEIVFTITLIK